MSRVGRFLSRGHTEKRVFYLAAVLVPVVRVGLAVLGFRRVRGWLLQRESRASRIDEATPEMVDWAVQSVARKTLYDRPCLTQSLVVSHLLRRAGFRPEVRIGVKKADDRLEAHAWVEIEGRVVSGGRRSPEIYTPLTSIDELKL